MKLFHKIPLFSGDGFPNCKSSGDMDVLWPDFWIELGHWAGKEIVDRGCLLPAQGHTIIYLAHQTILLNFLPLVMVIGVSNEHRLHDVLSNKNVYFNIERTIILLQKCVEN